MQEYEKQKLQPQIIFEDNELLIINKPTGLVVHSDGRTNEYTLADYILEQYPDIKNVGEPWTTKENTILRPGIVHRLDRETSGVMVIAKTQESYESLKKQFKNRDVQKEYRVILNCTFKEEVKEGVIDKPIGKSTSDFRKWSAQPGAKGILREAKTSYVILSRIGMGNDGYSYVSASPKTGRTHQIRVHFKAIHHCVLGDKLYGGKKIANTGIKIPRTMLHAYSIKFKNLKGELITYTAKMPEDFKQILKVVGLTNGIDQSKY